MTENPGPFGQTSTQTSHDEQHQQVPSYAGVKDSVKLISSQISTATVNGIMQTEKNSEWKLKYFGPV